MSSFLPLPSHDHGNRVSHCSDICNLSITGLQLRAENYHECQGHSLHWDESGKEWPEQVDSLGVLMTPGMGSLIADTRNTGKSHVWSWRNSLYPVVASGYPAAKVGKLEASGFLCFLMRKFSWSHSDPGFSMKDVSIKSFFLDPSFSDVPEIHAVISNWVTEMQEYPQN